MPNVQRPTSNVQYPAWGTWVRRGLIALLLAAILFRFVVAGWSELLANVNSNETDQNAFLSVGFKIQARAGLTDGNRHPLFPALISLFAEREWSYFTRAKLLSFAISTLGLIVVFWLSQRLYNAPVALGTVFLLSIGSEYLFDAPRAQAEALLALLYFVTWACQVRGINDQRWWALGGACAGLAYLTKVSGEALLITFLISTVLYYGRRVVRQRGVWAFVACYLVVALPLYIYNVQRFGNPRHNFSTAHSPWLDEWDQRYVGPGESPPTMRTYLQTHSASEIAWRMGLGVRGMPSLFAQALLPAGSPLVSLAGNFTLWLAALALLALCLALPRPRRWLRRYYEENKGPLLMFLPLLAVTYGGLAWFYLVAPDTRRIVPLAPMIILLVVDLLYRLAFGVEPQANARTGVRSLTARWPGARGVTRVGVAALYLGVLGWCLTSALAHALVLSVDPFATDRAWHEERAGVLGWLAERIADEDERVIYGPSHQLVKWRNEDVGSWKPAPSSLANWYEFEEFVWEMEARYVLLVPDMVNERARMFSPFFRVQDGAVYMERLAPGWKMVYTEPDSPPYSVCVLEAPAPLSPADIPQPMSVTFGGLIELMGYDVDREVAQPGEQVTLTLYWRALAPVDRDYTVFVHLLDEALRKCAGSDGQPLYDRAPTSAWEPGRIVADPHPMTLDAHLPPGETLFGVGLYLLETGERLGAVGPEGWLPENRVLLKGVEVR
jgi:hypothetical protein